MQLGEGLYALQIQLSSQLERYKQQLAFQQADWDSIPDSSQDAQTCCSCNGFLPPLFLLLSFPLSITGVSLLLRVMNRTIGVSADLTHFAFLSAFGDDGIRGVFAGFVLGPIPLLLRFIRANFDVLIAWKNRTALGRFAVSGRDLNQLWLGRDGRLYVRVNLGRIAIGV